MAGEIRARGVSAEPESGRARPAEAGPQVHVLRDNCWESLVRLAEETRRAESFEFACLRLGAAPDARIGVVPEAVSGSHRVLILPSGTMILPRGLDLARDAVFAIRGGIEAFQVGGAALLPEIGRFIGLYAPYALAPLAARRLGRAVLVAHFAQSLDGRIATVSGDAKGIGNACNLLHAHRMRALSDAVLIGAKTLERDRPRLTVRHVPGPGPVRVVLGSRFEGLESLTSAGPGAILLLGARHASATGQVEFVTLRRRDGWIAAADVLAVLFQRGLRTVYLEGGALTTSRFLEEDAVDILQLHIAPLVLGSGLPAFTLAPVERIADGLRFAASAFFPIDDGAMFVGALRPSAGSEAAPRA